MKYKSLDLAQPSLLAVCVLVLACPVRAERPGGVALMMQFEPGSAHTLALHWMENPPHNAYLPEPPMLNMESLQRAAPGTEEIVFTFHNNRGDRIKRENPVFALGGRPRAFRDHRGRGGLFTPASDQRFLMLPIPTRAGALLATRVRVLEKPDGRRFLDPMPLGLFVFGGDPKKFEPPKCLPIHLPGLCVTISPALIEYIPFSKPIGHLGIRPWCPYEEEPKFDIVIMGDGFDNSPASVSKYSLRAKAVKDTLSTMKPFSDLSQELRITIVDTPTEYNGIDLCPCDNLENVESLVRGNYQDAGAPGFYGTDNLAELMNRASDGSETPLCSIESVLVIPNCDVYGGAAYPEHKIAFASYEKEGFQDYLGLLAAHELGHVIAGLGDEYITCATEGEQYDGSVWTASDFPNIASARDVWNNTVPWTPSSMKHKYSDCPLGHPKQPTPGECEIDCTDNAGGYDCSDENGECTCEVDQYLWCFDEYGAPLDSSVPLDEVGLFWGAGFIEGPGAPCCCDIWEDSRGKNFYRPMATCRMRFWTHEFCQVCSDELTKVIQAAAQ